MSETLVLSAYGSTDIGRVRSANEDAILVSHELQVYAVADGAGGHNCGEVASHLALRSIENFFGATVRATHEHPEFDRFGIPNGARRLSRAILKANLDVLEIAKNASAFKGMGTTVVAASFSPRSGLLHVANVGDSRCYRLRAGHLELMTQDHSLITDIVEQRPDLDDEVLDRLPRNVVTRALGMDPKLRVSLRSHAVVPGDKYLLCSDGLSGVVSAEEIADTLALVEAPEVTVERFIAMANAEGGRDNVAAVLIECAGGHDHARPADSVPPMQDDAPDRASEPELFLLGIEELSSGHERTDDLARKVGELVRRTR